MGKGFTLVELSIVLVITGLIAGGVLGGSELINQARIRATITEIQKWDTSLNTFYMKYGYWPGDFCEADDYWPDVCSTYMMYNTCNGNCNGAIGSSNWNPPYESHYALKHMDLADLIEFEVIGTDVNNPELGEEIMPSDYGRGAGWSFSGSGAIGKVHWLWLHGPDYRLHRNGALRADDIYTIDRKMDDGQPKVGIIQVNNENTVTCNTDDFTYALAETHYKCSLGYDFYK